MENVVLAIHLVLALLIITLVLLQRSEGGGLGIGGGGLGKLASPKGATSALTRATAICAGFFFCTSIILGIMNGRDSQVGRSVLDSLDQSRTPVVEMPLTPSADPQKDKPPVSPEDTPAAPIAR